MRVFLLFAIVCLVCISAVFGSSREDPQNLAMNNGQGDQGAGDGGGQGGISAPGVQECAAKKPEGADLFTKDKCSICESITRNRFLWNWKSHPEALKTLTPPHLSNWVDYFSCRLQTCPEFRTGSCDVPNADGSTYTITPCLVEYICKNCLADQFESQEAGCFDGLYNYIS